MHFQSIFLFNQKVALATRRFAICGLLGKSNKKEEICKEMKTLDLNTYGVQEMNAVEMRETDGGLWWIVGVIVGGLIYDMISNPQETAAAWERGQKKALENIK
ncbi:MAG: hypothetical protein ACK5KP_09705 [Paludibacteraceae bacterium]